MEFLPDLSYVVLSMAVLIIAKLSLEVLTPFKINDELTAKDNTAFGISLVGYYVGVLIVFMGAAYSATDEKPEDFSLMSDLLAVFGWSALGILLLNISRMVLDRFVLHKFSIRKEIVEDQNCGMGAIEFGTYIGSALVIAGALSGEGGSIVTALAFYALGQAALMLFAMVYQKLTAYDFHKEIENDNVAAGIAYSGNIIAMGTLMLRGTAGDFIDWSENLSEFGFYLAAAFVLLIIGRFAIDFLLMPGRTLHEEIAADKNLNAGFLEGGVLIGLAGVIFLTV